MLCLCGRHQPLYNAETLARLNPLPSAAVLVRSDWRQVSGLLTRSRSARESQIWVIRDVELERAQLNGLRESSTGISLTAGGGHAMDNRESSEEQPPPSLEERMTSAHHKWVG